MQPGDKVYFSADPKQTVMTVKAVSPHVEMAELEEFEGGWCWIDSLVIVEPASEPDPIDEQLKFLGL